MSDINLKRLRLARERKGLTQIDIAKRLKWASSVAGQYERGDKEPTIGRLKALAKLLEVRVGWLLDDDEAAPPRVLPERGRRGYESHREVLDDYDAPAGLRDLAEAAQLVVALEIAPAEWRALGSVDFEAGLTLDGYLGLLALLRAASVQAQRVALDARPGRRPRPLPDGTGDPA